MPKSFNSQLKRFLGIVASTLTITSSSKEKSSSRKDRLTEKDTTAAAKDTPQPPLQEIEPRAEEEEEEEEETGDMSVAKTEEVNNDHLVQSDDADHPANLIPELCRRFYNWGWVTGTGGGVSKALPSSALPCA